MKLIKSEIKDGCHEIEIEKSFFFFKWRIIYREKNNSIMRFEYPDKYYEIGLSEYCDISGLFKHLSNPMPLFQN